MVRLAAVRGDEREIELEVSFSPLPPESGPAAVVAFCREAPRFADVAPGPEAAPGALPPAPAGRMR